MLGPFAAYLLAAASSAIRSLGAKSLFASWRLSSYFNTLSPMLNMDGPFERNRGEPTSKPRYIFFPTSDTFVSNILKLRRRPTRTVFWATTTTRRVS